MKLFKRLMLNISLVALVSIILLNSTYFLISGQENLLSYPSYPVSYIANHSNEKVEALIDGEVFNIENEKVYKKINNKRIEVDFTQGLYDKKQKNFFFTKQSPTSWGSEKYLYTFSIRKNKVIAKVEFDNSGYYKYPISISPDSKIIAIAERAQSVGEVTILLINLENGKTLLKLEKVYSPTLEWINKNTFVYLSPSIKCIDQTCVQTNIEIIKKNLLNKNAESKVVGRIDSNGVESKLDNLEIINDEIVLTRRLDNKKLDKTIKKFNTDFNK